MVAFQKPEFRGQMSEDRRSVIHLAMGLLQGRPLPDKAKTGADFLIVSPE